LSKIFKKLILEQLWSISRNSNVDLKGETQHSFKAKRILPTAALTMEPLISRALDEKCYRAKASLNLRTAFNEVDRRLLFKFSKVM
jgi:hypothetical protein